MAIEPRYVGEFFRDLGQFLPHLSGRGIATGRIYNDDRGDTLS